MRHEVPFHLLYCRLLDFVDSILCSTRIGRCLVPGLGRPKRHPPLRRLHGTARRGPRACRSGTLFVSSARLHSLQCSLSLMQLLTQLELTSHRCRSQRDEIHFAPAQSQSRKIDLRPCLTQQSRLTGPIGPTPSELRLRHPDRADRCLRHTACRALLLVTRNDRWHHAARPQTRRPQFTSHRRGAFQGLRPGAEAGCRGRPSQGRTDRLLERRPHAELDCRMLASHVRCVTSIADMPILRLCKSFIAVRGADLSLGSIGFIADGSLCVIAALSIGSSDSRHNEELK